MHTFAGGPPSTERQSCYLVNFIKNFYWFESYFCCIFSVVL